MPTHVIMPETRARVIELIRAGESKRAIAGLCGVSVSYVWLRTTDLMNAGVIPAATTRRTTARTEPKPTTLPVKWVPLSDTFIEQVALFLEGVVTKPHGMPTEMWEMVSPLSHPMRELLERRRNDRARTEAAAS